jgi:hypothetical protein
MKDIYVLVLVTYQEDFRLQENLYIGTEEQCMKKIDELFTNTPIYKYLNTLTDLAHKLDREEKQHYWLQHFKLDI